MGNVTTGTSWKNSWKGKQTGIAVTAAGPSDVIGTIYVREGASYLWAEVNTVGASDMDAFWVQISCLSDASFHTIANAPSDYTTDIQDPILGCSADMTTLSASTAGLLRMSVKGLFAVRFRGSLAGDATVDLRWQMR